MRWSWQLLALSGVLSAMLIGTSACPPPLPPGPPQPSSGGSTANDGGAGGQATCANVCDHWDELGCEEGADTPSGQPCEAVCENIQGSGIVEWNLGCRARIARCVDIDGCER